VLIVLVVNDGTFHSSVGLAGGGPSPPKASALVFVPFPLIFTLALFKSFCSVQLTPFHVSVSLLKLHLVQVVHQMLKQMC
jgi:hypothetical protein